MGFSRQEYWSRLPCPPPGDLPDAGIETMSLASPALGGRFFTIGPPKVVAMMVSREHKPNSIRQFIKKGRMKTLKEGLILLP